MVPSDDERVLAATVRDVLGDLAPPDKCRLALEGDRGFDDSVWRALAGDVGLSGLTIPEEHGGLGLGWAAAAAVHVEFGRALYSGPFLATALAASALVAADDDAVAARWLPVIAAGELTATVAVADVTGAWDSAGVQASRIADGWLLSGTRHFVIAGHIADLILVVARTSAGDSLFAVDAALPGIARTPMTGLDLTRRLALLEFRDCPAALVGPEGFADVVIARLGSQLRMASAAEAAGGLGWCLDTCVEYASNREQFGRVIGSYQAVAHPLVDMLGARRTADACSRWSAVAADLGAPDAMLAGHVAALRAGEAYIAQTESGVHLLGGIGFTWEHDMHLHYRRARAQAALAGGAAQHRRAIAGLSGL